MRASSHFFLNLEFLGRLGVVNYIESVIAYLLTKQTNKQTTLLLSKFFVIIPQKYFQAPQNLRGRVSIQRNRNNTRGRRELLPMLRRPDSAPCSAPWSIPIEGKSLTSLSLSFLSCQEKMLN